MNRDDVLLIGFIVVCAVLFAYLGMGLGEMLGKWMAQEIRTEVLLEF